MSEPEKKPDAPVVEVPAKPEAPAVPEAPKAEEKKERTIGEIMSEEGGKKKEEAPSSETVPLASFLDAKNGRKKAEERVAELEAIINGGGTKAEISADIEALAKKHNVDSAFLRDLAGSIEAGLRVKLSAEADEKLKPITERDRQEKIDKAFETHFGQAMEEMPEFKDVVNKEAIKILSLDPKNAKKTFKQIIEETYGDAVPGKRTIEQKKPGGTKEPGEIDFEKAKKDAAYFAEIMADPVLKKKYNANIENRIGF